MTGKLIDKAIIMGVTRTIHYSPYAKEFIEYRVDYENRLRSRTYSALTVPSTVKRFMETHTMTETKFPELEIAHYR